MGDATATEDPQTTFEETELEDDGLLAALNAWAEADTGVVEEKETAKPYNKAVDKAKEEREEARAAVNVRLTTMEIEIEGDDSYRCGTYRLTNKHRAEEEREFTIKEKNTLKIEAAS